MPRYSDERKASVLRKMLQPHRRPLTEVSIESLITGSARHNRRRNARDQDRLLPDATARAGL